MADGPMRSAVAVAPERLESGDLGPVAGATDDAWAKVLAKVVPACVVLKGASQGSVLLLLPCYGRWCISPSRS